MRFYTQVQSISHYEPFEGDCYCDDGACHVNQTNVIVNVIPSLDGIEQFRHGGFDVCLNGRHIGCSLLPRLATPMSSVVTVVFPDSYGTPDEFADQLEKMLTSATS
jgi:hypothetical protein